MNVMPIELRTHSRELRTPYRFDESGLLFVSCDEPRASLSFKVDSTSIQDDITMGLIGLFSALDEPIDDLQLIDLDHSEFVWLVTSPAFERVLQVA